MKKNFNYLILIMFYLIFSNHENLFSIKVDCIYFNKTVDSVYKCEVRDPCFKNSQIYYKLYEENLTSDTLIKIIYNGENYNVSVIYNQDSTIIFSTPKRRVRYSRPPPDFYDTLLPFHKKTTLLSLFKDCNYEHNNRDIFRDLDFSNNIFNEFVKNQNFGNGNFYLGIMVRSIFLIKNCFYYLKDTLFVYMPEAFYHYNLDLKYFPTKPVLIKFCEK